MALTVEQQDDSKKCTTLVLVLFSVTGALTPLVTWPNVATLDTLTSTTEANPNKPFFGCPNYNVNGKRWCDLFVWADIGEEDLEERVISTVDGDQARVDLAWRVGKLEAEPGVGTNFKKLASLKDVAELAPCNGSIVTDPDGGGEDLLLVCNLDGLAENGVSSSAGAVGFIVGFITNHSKLIMVTLNINSNFIPLNNFW
ncbi:hypothetical protein Ahy_B05g074718 [Arachis hypogaea]|uniref:Zinc finger GRF-type domain-containing protein n=1 Tax=Arachis hypogaea TaxID=3818 RepID=A0A444YZN2_ARAHY|nr:hypothetical protein Ahy_B05g074718 [Arachis hypogaea]